MQSNVLCSLQFEADLRTRILLTKLISSLRHIHKFGLPLSTERRKYLSLLGVAERNKRGSHQNFAIDLNQIEGLDCSQSSPD